MSTSLYELHGDFKELYRQLEALSLDVEQDPDQIEAILKAIDGIEGDMATKIRNTMYHVRNLEADQAEIKAKMDAFKAEHDRLGSIHKRYQGLIDRHTDRLVTVIDDTQQPDPKGIKRFDLGIDGKLSIGISEFVQELPGFDVSAHPMIQKTPKPPELDKTKAKAMLKKGLEIKGLSLDNRKFLRY